ncbi:hypothetical protein B0H14DRAFT_2607537 [Mycena olivaceomarginata]|nr:hypothetical protein B0H14DRAFT_2607537 [Mycena olivaceomarginata]
MPKVKARPSGLNRGGNFRSGSKKCKANKENFTVYVATVQSDSEDDIDAVFSSLPVRGTHSRPTESRNTTQAPPLRASYADDDDILPHLEPVSDDEGDDDADIQADDEADKDAEEDLDDLMGLWDEKEYAELYNKLCVPTSTTAPAPGPAAVAEEDEEMPFAPYDDKPMDVEQPREHGTRTSSPSTSSPANTPSDLDAFANPWQQPNAAPTPSSSSAAGAAPSPSVNPWRFNFSADIDDQYFEEYDESGSDDNHGQAGPDDARYDSVDEEPGEGEPEGRPQGVGSGSHPHLGKSGRQQRILKSNKYPYQLSD